MKLYFKCTNSDVSVWINSIKFELSDGEELIIDRDRTEWSFDDDGTCSMTWLGCYIWNGEEEDYNIHAKDLDGAEIISIDIEDDAPIGYEFSILEWEAED